MMAAQSVVFPIPFRPTTATDSLVHREGDAVQRLCASVVGVEARDFEQSSHQPSS